MSPVCAPFGTAAASTRRSARAARAAWVATGRGLAGAGRAGAACGRAAGVAGRCATAARCPVLRCVEDERDTECDVECDVERELDSVRNALVARGIEYALCGGLAVAVHGFVRATKDIDIVPSPGPANARRLFEALDHLDAKPKEIGDFRPEEMPASMQSHGSD